MAEISSPRLMEVHRPYVVPCCASYYFHISAFRNRDWMFSWRTFNPRSRAHWTIWSVTSGILVYLLADGDGRHERDKCDVFVSLAQDRSVQRGRFLSTHPKKFAFLLWNRFSYVSIKSHVFSPSVIWRFWENPAGPPRPGRILLTEHAMHEACKQAIGNQANTENRQHAPRLHAAPAMWKIAELPSLFVFPLLRSPCYGSRVTFPATRAP